MAVGRLTGLIERLPPGRARARYERLANVADPLLITVPYSDEVLWLVGDPGQARRVASVGVPRWCIWTLGELQDLLGACGRSVAEVPP